MHEAPGLRPNQERAVTTRGKNLVVVAGAGTGKTRVLVERYLWLLEQGYALPSIVAITYTERAAGEMRQRIRDAIIRQADASSGDAKDLWEKHYRQMDAARISTIHSLCAALLRANPAEAEIDPRFEVLEEADAMIWQEEALDASLAELAEVGGEELALFGEYAIKDVRETCAQLLKRGVAAEEAFACVPATADALLAEWRLRLEDVQRAGVKRLLSDVRWHDAGGWIRHKVGNKSEDALEAIRVEDCALLDTLEAANAGKFWAVILELAARRKVGKTGSAKAWADVTLAREMLNMLRDVCREYVGAYALTFSDDDRRAAEMILLWRKFWSRVHQEYTRHKALERALDFDDLEAQARRLLRDHSDVRDRYRAEFSTVLVDEFQDTNGAQRDIVYDLASPAEADRLFVVGDGKQSIYGFRGADVSVFTVTLNNVVDRWGNEARIPLDESFRTHTRLVECFNHLFGRIFAVDGERAAYEIPYEAMTAMRASPVRAPWLEILQIPKTITVNGADTELMADEVRQWEARELAARVKQFVAEKFQVWDKHEKRYRDVRYGDIALLFRVGTVFPIYEEQFKAAGLPYITQAGKGYYDRAEVRDLLNLLRALDNPYDDLALATILHSPLYALSSETLYRLRRGGKHLREALNQPPGDILAPEAAHVEFARKSLEALWTRVGRVPILDLLKSALEDTAYLATIASLSDGKRRRANVEKLLARARRTGLVRLSEFNAYVRDLTAQEVREGEAMVDGEDALQLMSIHRAKGLEFPIVVIPDAARAPYDPSEMLLADRGEGVAVKVYDESGVRVKPVAFRMMETAAARRDDAEEKRLLYVALTRAQDYLIISGSEKMDAKSYLAQVLDAISVTPQLDSSLVEIRAPQSSWTEKNFAPGVMNEVLHPDEDRGMESTGADLPTLVRPLMRPQIRDLHSFTPTGVEALTRDRAEFEQRFLEGAPERILPVTRSTTSAHAPAYIVGEMAHRAIQRWRFPENTPNLDALLGGYAEERGLTDVRARNAAAREARGLLEKFARSGLYRAMAEARARRQEVPFLMAWQGRLIHGTVDALFQTTDGKWYIADFKTDRLRDKQLSARAYTLENYGVQIALYERAVAAELGEDVCVRVHYIREEETLELTHTDLNSALESARIVLDV